MLDRLPGFLTSRRKARPSQIQNDAIESQHLSDSVTLANKNFLYNGDFIIAQRGITFDSTTTPVNGDDTVLLDRWVNTSNGANVVDVSQTSADLPLGARSAITLDVETANLKFGIVQILEGIDARQLRDQAFSLSLKAKITGSSMANERLGFNLLAWTGTEDTVTSDVVDSTNWSIKGTRPVLATSWNYVNTDAYTPATLSTSWTTYKIENQNSPAGSVLDSDANNVAVFIWIDETTITVADTLLITDVQLEIGPAATGYERRKFSDEFYNCRRFYQKTFPYATAPAEAGGLAGSLIGFESNTGDDGIRPYHAWRFNPELFRSPTVVTYNPSVSGSTWEEQTTGTVAATVNDTSTAGCNIVGDTNLPVTEWGKIHATADAEL